MAGEESLMKFRTLVLSLCLLAWLAAAQQAPHKEVAPTTPCETACDAALTPADIAALRADLNRMETLVDQMERNLAFIEGQTPLKHQFELEIEMWRMTTRQMQER